MFQQVLNGERHFTLCLALNQIHELKCRLGEGLE